MFKTIFSKKKCFLFTLKKESASALILCLWVLFALCTIDASAQTSGLIYKPASGTGKTVMDPNSDGYSSATSAGFTTSDYGNASELKMVATPQLMTEPSGDILTGATGGHTDIVDDGTNKKSVYILTKNGNLIIRFRIGKASTAAKGYSLLIDTDNQFGPTASNYSSINPGFEKEVVLETTKRVVIYDYTGAAGYPKVYDLDSHHQRSIAVTVNNGDPDYFYDYYVPLADIGPDVPVRFAATTITSAGSGIGGTASDINGVDDRIYNNNAFSIYQSVISSFPPVKFSDIVEGASFGSILSTSPTITSSVATNSTTISGASQEADGTAITLYRKVGAGSYTAITSSPTVINGSWSWTISGVTLSDGDLIYATATASGKGQSAASNIVQVTGAQSCYTPAPVISSRNNGAQSVSGTWSNGSTIAANSVRIHIYQQTATNTFTELNSATVQYVNTDGTFTALANIAQNVFNPAVILVTATLGTCTSGYSNAIIGNTGTITTAPAISTTSLIASSTSQNVSVTNTDASAATLILYVNGTEKARTTSTVASGSSNTFSYSGFIEGDIVTARAQSSGSNTFLSPVSNSVTVGTASTIQSSAPVLTGTYIAGSSKTVTGTSNEITGTTIYLYKTVGGTTTQIGTTTVNNYGNWSITGLTLTAGDVLSAKAKATGKTLSNTSNTFTVAAGAPSAPTVSGPIQAGSTAISGSGGTGTVSVYIDGSVEGTVTGTGSWTLANILAADIYKNASVTATNTVNGIESAQSNAIIVSGASNFLLEAAAGGNIGTQVAGVPFSVNITARNSSNATFTNYTGTNVMSSGSTITSGAGPTNAFTSGVLSGHSVTLTKAGTYTLNTVSTTDPTLIGTSNSFTVLANANNSLAISQQPSATVISEEAFSQQPVIAIKDAYGNTATSDNLTEVTVSSASGTGTLNGDKTVKAVNGIVTFSGLSITGSGTYTLQFASASSTAVTSNAITVSASTPAAPTNLSYTSPNVFYQGSAINNLIPSVTGTVSSYSVSSSLPAGLYLNSGTGVISGTPTSVSSQSTYTVTASNSSGSTSFGIVITVDAASVVPVPIITTSGTLTAFNSCSGSASTQQSFTVSGSNLTSNITITPPVGFQLSTISGGPYSSVDIILTPTNGTLSNTTLYVRMASATSSPAASNINLVSNGATTQTVAISGTVNALPAITTGTVASVNTTATSFIIPYSTTTGSPDQYSIITGSRTLSNFTIVNNAALVSSPITISIPASSPGTYDFNLTVSNSVTGCVSAVVPITLTVTASSSAQLSNLTLGSGTLSPTFSSATTTYTATVNNSVSSITLIPTVSDVRATVTVNGTSVTSGSSSPNIPLNIGSNTITIVVTAEDGTTQKTYNLTVTRLQDSQSITFNLIPAKTYGDTDFDAGANASSGLAVNYTSSNSSVATFVNGNVHIVGVGTTTITASQSGSVNYNAAADVAQTLTVNKAPLTITATNQTKTYGTVNPDPTVSYIGFVNRESSANLTIQPTVITPATTASPVGSYPINVSGAMAANYQINYINGVLSIYPGIQIITFTVSPKTYGDPDFTLNATASSGLPVTYSSSNPAIATVDANGLVHIVEVGNVTISALQLGNNNYIATTRINQQLTINRASLTLTADDQAKSYGAANPALTITYSGFVNGDTNTSLTTSPVISTTATTASAVGTYPITVLGAASANYIINYVRGTLTVGQISQTITFASLSDKVYGDADFALAGSSTSRLPLTYTSSDPSVATVDAAGAVHILSAGTTTITASQAGNENYSGAAAVAQILTVNKAPLVLTVTNQNKVYGTDNPVLTFTYTGFVNGDTNAGLITPPAISTTATATSAAGIYPISISEATAANYAFTYVPGTLTITKAILTVKADNKFRIYGLANPVFTVTYSGFVNGETAASLTAAPELSTTANTVSPAGIYPITISGGAAANYNFTFIPGTLTVTNATVNSVSLAQITLLENQPAGILAGTLAAASLDVNAVYTYSLVAGTGAADNALFTIAGNKVTTVRSLDYELKSSYSILVRATNQYGLYLDQVFSINIVDVNEVPTLAAIPNQAVCYGLSVQNISLSGITPGPESAQNNSLSVSSTNPGLFKNLTVSAVSNGTATLNYQLAGSGTAVVTVTNKDNGGIANGGTDSFSQTFTITANDMPVASIASAQGTQISKGETVTLTATGGSSYNWDNAFGIIGSTNTATIQVRPNQTTTYQVKVSNASGCSTVSHITINVADDYSLVHPANILTPNGDGKNDTWVVKNIDLYPNNTVSIFDKGGRKLLEVKSYANNWDGTLNGSALAEGTYYYVIDFGQGKGPMKGFITILRNR
ncbi:MAG: MBG domain-containing protein [Janthinobacterium lividum]